MMSLYHIHCFYFRPVDPKSFFRIWLNKIQEKFKEKANINQDDPEAVNNGPSALVMATQSAALGGMVLPLLLDCNRPPKRRTTDIKLKDLQLAKQALLNPSTDAHKETQEVRSIVMKCFFLTKKISYLLSLNFRTIQSFESVSWFLKIHSL